MSFNKMIILGLDSSEKTASAALCDGKTILAEGFINVKLTHSETLLPLVENILKASKINFKDIGGIAVVSGPGSFTGTRISMSAVKGISMALDIPIYPVSALRALAFNLIGFDCIAVPAMDARREQVYGALFRIKGETVERLTEDRALLAKDLCTEMEQFLGEKIITLGDGNKMVMDKFSKAIPAPPMLIHLRASSVCFAIDSEQSFSADTAMPIYLRNCEIIT